MLGNFQSFVDRLARESRFDRNAIQRIYEKTFLGEKKENYLKFQKKFQATWKSWVEINGPEYKAAFFVNYGDVIIRNWIQACFPFSSTKERLILGFKSGGTNEDFVIHMFYRFSKAELQSLTLSLEKNKIQKISLDSALIRMFLESFLALRHIISKAVGYKYSIMIEEAKILTKNKGKILLLELVARPAE